MRRSIGVKDYLVLHAALLMYAVVSLFAKSAGLALVAEDFPRAAIFMGLEGLTLLAYAVVWQISLKRMPLTLAYSNKAVTVLWTCLFGVMFFGESITPGKAAGIMVVLIGVYLVVTDNE